VPKSARKERNLRTSSGAAGSREPAQMQGFRDC
jgi:hypothetical protein